MFTCKHNQSPTSTSHTVQSSLGLALYVQSVYDMGEVTELVIAD